MKNNVSFDSMLKIFFFRDTFKIVPQVFYPRYETEQLVDLTLNYSKIFSQNQLDVLEIGVGSGVISLSLGLNCPKWNIDAVDIENRALKLAKLNQKRLMVNNVNLFKSDFFQKINKKKYHLIIANLPYVDINDDYQKSLLCWDPKTALFSNNKGLEHFEKFFHQVKKYLHTHYLIALEIGDKQTKALLKLIKIFLPFSNISVKKDYNKLDRFIFIYE